MPRLFAWKQEAFRSMVTAQLSNIQHPRRKVYLETSVISYLTARPSKTILGAAHQQITAAWWEQRAAYELLVSESVLRECAAGDAAAAQKRLALVADLPLLRITENALDIAQALLERRIIPSKAAEDALHIAIATTHAVDYLLTWNCRHIANPELQRNTLPTLMRLAYFCRLFVRPKNFWEKKMLTDDIVEEVRAVREAHAAKFGFDLRAIYADLKASEAARVLGGRVFVEPPMPAAIVDTPRTRFAQR